MFGVFYPGQSYPAEAPDYSSAFVYVLDICDTSWDSLMPERTERSLMTARTERSLMAARTVEPFCEQD